MKLFLLGAFTMYCVASLFYFCAEWEGHQWAENALDWFIKPWCAIGIVIMFIPCMVWHFVQHLFQPYPDTLLPKYKAAYPDQIWSLNKKETLLLLSNGKNCKWWRRYYLARIKFKKEDENEKG